MSNPTATKIEEWKRKEQSISEQCLNSMYFMAIHPLMILIIDQLTSMNKPSRQHLAPNTMITGIGSVILTRKGFNCSMRLLSQRNSPVDLRPST